MGENDLFKQAFFQSNIVQLMIPLDQSELIFNHAFCEFLGCSETEITMSTIQDFLHPDDYEMDLFLYKELLSGRRTSYQIEKRFIHKSGQIVWGLLTVNLLDHCKDQKQYILGQLVDITEKKQMETALCQSEKQYRIITENTSDLIIRHAKDGKILYASPSSIKITGYSPAELYEQNPYHYIHIEDITEVRKTHNLIFTGKQDLITTYRIKHKNGHYIWLETTIHCIENGTEVELIATSRDITRRKEAELKLRKSERKLSNILESISDGFVVLDFDFKYVLLNKSTERLLEINRDEWIGRKPDEIFGQAILKRFYQVCNEVMKQGKMISYENYFKPVDKWFEVKVYMIEEGIAIYFRDISLHKTMMNQILESEKRYRNLVNHSPVPIMVHDEEKIIFINKAGMELYKAEDRKQLEGLLLRVIHPASDWGIKKAEISKLFMQKNVPRTLESRHITFDGQELHVEITTIKTDYIGKPAILAIIKDITEKKRVEQLLLRSEKLAVVGQLAAAVAHEVRNPLTSIKGFIQLNKSNKKYNETYNNIIFDELKRVETIIYEFLSMAKPHHEKLESVKIDQLLLQVVTLLETQATMKNITILTDIHTAPFIQCDPNSIKQVFINIIQNSIEAIDQNGLIHIKLIHMTDRIDIEVKDNGSGISKDRLKKLGEPFYSTKEKGTGLGLMTCLRIIENHKGSITFDSEEGMGTTVNIRLPIKLQSIKIVR